MLNIRKKLRRFSHRNASSSKHNLYISVYHSMLFSFILKFFIHECSLKLLPIPFYLKDLFEKGVRVM